MEIREQILAKLPKAANCHHLQTTDLQVIDNEPCEVVSENGQF